MQPIEAEIVKSHLKNFHGKPVYIHCEITPGGFVRNPTITVVESFLNGTDPYRATLKLTDNGWVRIEGLTDFEIDHKNRLLLAGHDHLGRLTAALQLSHTPFNA